MFHFQIIALIIYHLLTFSCVDDILWCHHSKETSLTDLFMHGATSNIFGFFKNNIEIL